MTDVNIFTTLMARNLNPVIRILARANDPSSVEKLYRAGADYVALLPMIGGQTIGRIVLDEYVTILARSAGWGSRDHETGGNAARDCAGSYAKKTVSGSSESRARTGLIVAPDAERDPAGRRCRYRRRRHRTIEKVHSSTITERVLSMATISGCRMGQVEQMIRYAYWNSGTHRYRYRPERGVDSAVAAAFCCRAVGPEKVLGLSLPSSVSNPDGSQGCSRTLHEARNGPP